MRRFSSLKFACTLALSVGLGAAPAAPSYRLVVQPIDEIQKVWSEPQAKSDPNAPGWNAFFDALKKDLSAYATAKSEDDQLAALNRLYQMSVAVRGIEWPPVARVREALRAWLRPRVRLAWAERQLLQSVRQLAPTQNAALLKNRQRWVEFVGRDLGDALRLYDKAATVPLRQDALKRIYGALHALDSTIKTPPWLPGVSLEQALNDLYNQPNLDVAADVPTVRPWFENDVVTSGPVYRKGYVSQVTAGPKTGFGLLPSDDGVAFYNSQLLTSVTPIGDFQQQVASDRRGRRAARLYYFEATSSDSAELTIISALRADGLHLWPTYQHGVDAAIASIPQPGRGFGRFVAALIGMGPNRITRKVYQGAIGRIAQNVVTEAQELAQERANEAAAQRNVQLSKNLVGGNKLVFENLEIERLSLRLTPQFALVGGDLQWRGAGEQVGADASQPPQLVTPESGITADLHLGSVMTCLTRGYLQSEGARSVRNLMIVTRRASPGAAPRERFTMTRNTDYPTFLKAVETARAAKDPRVLAIRVKRPGRSPEFAADARGFLVALLHDFVVEVPAPEPGAAPAGLAGPPAKIYRISAPNSEFTISFKIAPASQKEPLRLTGRIEGFDPGPRAQVFAVNDDENKAVPLTTFTSTFVLGLFGARLQGQPIDLPLSNIKLTGFTINAVSGLDPSGWIRVLLTRQPGAVPAQPVAPTAVRPSAPARVTQR